MWLYNICYFLIVCWLQTNQDVPKVLILLYLSSFYDHSFSLTVIHCSKSSSHKSNTGNTWFYKCTNYYLVLYICRTPLKPDQEVSEPDWEVYLRETANMIIQQQSPRRLLEVRGRLYELLTHCIPAEIIMKVNIIQLLIYNMVNIQRMFI